MSEADVETQTAAKAEAQERHASWLELFFDLIVAAGVAVVADRLREAPTLANTAACLAMFYAIWSVWTAFCVYANAAGVRTRTRSLLVAMLGMGVLVASVPTTLPALLPDADAGGLDRTKAFVIAFVVCRTLAGAATRRAGKVIAFWPAVQGVMVVPWIASLGFGPPALYWLWGVGIVLDVAVSVKGARDPATQERLVEHLRKEQAEEERNVARRLLGHYRRPAPHPEIVVAEVERSHLEERLSLFVIIVLGEALALLVAAAARLPWTKPADIGLVVGFALLVGIWQLTARYGYGPVPGAADAPMRPWVALPTHFAVVAGIAAIAAGLGNLAQDPTATTQTGERWYLCGGITVYLLAGVLSGLGRSVPRVWTLGWVVPCVVAAVLLGLLGGALAGWAVTLIAAAIIGWQVLYQPIRDRVERNGTTLAR
jgi:low temperature requirement protein LtrA